MLACSWASSSSNSLSTGCFLLGLGTCAIAILNIIYLALYLGQQEQYSNQRQPLYQVTCYPILLVPNLPIPYSIHLHQIQHQILSAKSKIFHCIFNLVNITNVSLQLHQQPLHSLFLNLKISLHSTLE